MKVTVSAQTSSNAFEPERARWALQFCHCHYGPFGDVGRQYADTLRRLGYRVCTVYLTGEKSESIRALTNCDEVIFLAFTSKQVGGLKLAAIRAFLKIVRARPYEFVVAHRFKPIYIASLACPLPVIGVSHSFGDYSRFGRRLFANLFRSRLTLLGVSNAVRDEIRQSLPTWPTDKIQTFYNRLDVDRVLPALVGRQAARDQLGLPQGAFVVANVGRLHPDKDQATLITAFAQARGRLPAGALLVIVGSGRLEARLKALAAELQLGDSIRFAGQVAEIWRYFKAFDVFALSSDHEPFGMVLLEAMAAGVPIVATNCGGAPEVVGELGALFKLGDQAQLGEALVEMSSMTELQRTEYATAALARLREMFSDDASVAACAKCLPVRPPHAAVAAP